MRNTLKSWLTRVELKRAFGLLVDGEVVTMAVASLTLGGPVLRQTLTREVGARPLAACLGELLNESGCLRARGSRLVTGLGPAAVFYTAAPASGLGRSPANAQTVLATALRELPQAAGGLITDQVTASVEGKTFSLVAAMRRPQLVTLLEALKTHGLKPNRHEPSPCAALRAALESGNAPARQIRILCGAEQNIAYLTAGEVPLAWTCVPVRSGHEVDSLISSVRTLEHHARRRCALGPSQALVLQGTDLAPEVRQLVEEATGLPVSLVAGPRCDARLTAFGLALGGLESKPRIPNLVSVFQDPPSLLQSFPWNWAAFAVSLILWVGLALSDRAAVLRTKIEALGSAAARMAWMRSTPLAELRKEQSELQRQLDRLQGFIDQGVRWSPVLARLPEFLPDNTRLTGIQLTDLIDRKAATKDKGSRFLSFSAEAGFDTGLTSAAKPEEIQKCLKALRGSPLIRPIFPRVELQSIRWVNCRANRVDGAQGAYQFSVLCRASRKGTP